MWASVSDAEEGLRVSWAAGETSGGETDLFEDMEVICDE